MCSRLAVRPPQTWGRRAPMAEPITQARLRALAAVHPDQGRVLSVFLNLDPTAVRDAQRAIVRDHVGDDRRGAQGRARATGSRTTSGWRCATTSSASATCSLARTSPPTARAPWPSTRADRPTCSRSSACAGPVDEQGRARPHGVRRAARAARHRRALDGAAHQPPRRAAVLRPGRRARGDRPASSTTSTQQHEQGRLVAVQLPALGGARRSTTTSQNAADLAFELYKKRGARPRAGRRAGRAAAPSSRASCTRT